MLIIIVEKFSVDKMLSLYVIIPLGSRHCIRRRRRYLFGWNSSITRMFVR